MRRWRLVGLVVVVLAIGAALLGFRGGDDERRTTLQRQDLVTRVEVEGTLRSLEAVTIGPPAVPDIWNFKISSLVPEGTEVKAGDPVLGFDTTELMQTLQEKIGERDSAGKALDKKTSELAIERQDLELQIAEARSRLRKGSLALEVPEDLVARQELTSKRIDHTLAETEIASLEGRLRQIDRRGAAELGGLRGKRDRAARRVEELQRYMSAMEVQAPRAGTVVYVVGDEGEKSKVGDSVWRAQTVLEIPDLTRLLAEGKVDEAEMGRLAVGQRVTLRLDALPDRTFQGKVETVSRSVEPRSEGDPAKVVKVGIALTNPDPTHMRPGMRFRGEVEVERVAKVLCLPLEALSGGAGGAGTASVSVAGRLGHHEVTPRLGRRDDRCVEVLAGLEEGDEVVLPAADGGGAKSEGAGG